MTPFKQYEALLLQAQPIARKYLSDSEQITNGLLGKVAEHKIHVMLFGAYNAGKSTLINALLGSELAKVGDVPTTDHVDPYDWDGHVLLDTPGVNAPIEHEEVSLAQLQRVDLVLFLLRQEDQDADDVMRRIFDLLEQQRPLFLLVNYQDDAPEAINNIRASLNSTLLAYAKKRGIASNDLARVPVVFINADVAMRARLAGKLALQAYSGYDDFTVRFANWLYQFDQDEKRLESTLGIIERTLLEPVNQSIDAQTADLDDAKQVALQLEHLRREFRILRNNTDAGVRAELDLRRTEIAAVFDDARDEQAIISGVTKIADAVADKVQQRLQRDIRESLDRALKESLRVAGIAAPEVGKDKGDSSAFQERIKQSLIDGVKRTANEKNLRLMMEYGRKLKIPGLKGRWGKTLDKWAGKAGPWIQVAIGLLEIGVAHHEEQRNNAGAENAALQRNQWVNEVHAQIAAGLQANLDEVLTAIEVEVLQPLQKQRDELARQGGAIAQDRGLWDDLTRQFRSVRFDPVVASQ
ncbi:MULTISPECIES: GTPase [Achromobacter]|uniref:GTPase n=1 Tax=Achromobacter TaxID=222 RepID=UPI0025C657E7|nr:MULTISPECIES: GTPase [Achromobacter]